MSPGHISVQTGRPFSLKPELEILGEGRPSETASCDAVLQDEAADRLNTSRSSGQCAANGITHFMPFGNAAAIEPKGLLARLVDCFRQISRLCSYVVSPLSKNRH